MRLLDTRTGRFRWVEDPRQVRYAILSHVWSRDRNKPEQTYQDVLRFQEEAGNGPILSQLSEKLRKFCQVSLENGFELGWADSCCIDKTSSSELSEAINSMYDWYRYAAVCYAFLHDVASHEDPEVWRQQFCDSEWFTRGWTLQELLAPSILLFLSKTWGVLGSKQTLATLVESVTRIDRTVLTFERSLDEVSVARKMSWAASRKTSREEDKAYSLMGIFGVSIPITYGEGHYAFIRLQEEIIRVVPDQSIFAWGPFLHRHKFEFASPDDAAVASMPEPPSISLPSTSSQYLLAQSPKDFEHSSRFIHLSREAFAERLGIPPQDAYQVFAVTSYGMHTRLPLVAVVSQGTHDIIPTHLALLACEDQKDGRLLALLLRPHVQSTGTGFSVGTVVGKMPDLVAANALASTGILLSFYSRATFLSLQEVDQCLRRRFFRMANVYIPHRPSRIASENERDEPFHTGLRDIRDSFEVRLSGWSRKLLSLQGYRVSPGADRPDVDIALHNRTLNTTLAPGVVIANDNDHISIQVGRCNCGFGPRCLGVLVWSRNAESSLERDFMEERHLMNHPVHIPSWDFRGGIASTKVDLYPRSPPGRKITLRITFCHDSAVPSNSSTKAYQLGVEVTTSEDSITHLSQSESVARERRLENIARTYPPRQTTQQHTDIASAFVPAPRPLQRVRSNSAPYVPPFDEPLMNAGTHDSLHHSVLPANGIPQRLDAPGLPPSPPITAENSRSSDVDYWQYSTGQHQHQTPRNYDRQAYGGHHGDNHHLERGHPPASTPSSSQKPTQRKASLLIPTPQPAGWGGPRSPLTRRRSLDNPPASPRLEQSRGPATASRDDSYLVDGYLLPSGQQPVRPPPRSAMTDDQGLYQTPLGNGAPGVRSLSSLGWFSPEHGGGTQSHIPDFVRSESPDQLAGADVDAGREMRRRFERLYHAGSNVPHDPVSSLPPGFVPNPPRALEPNGADERKPTRQSTDGRHQPQPWQNEGALPNAAALRTLVDKHASTNQQSEPKSSVPVSSSTQRTPAVSPPEIRINPPSPVSGPAPASTTVSENGAARNAVDLDRAAPSALVPSSTAQRPSSDHRPSGSDGSEKDKPSLSVNTAETKTERTSPTQKSRKRVGSGLGGTLRKWFGGNRS